MLQTPSSLCSALTPPLLKPEHQQQQQLWHHHVAKELQRSAGGLGLAAVALLGAPTLTPASQALQLEVDFNALVQVAKDNQDAVKKLALQTAGAVKVTGTPDNLIQFVRDAGAGDVILKVNGLPIDVSLQSEKGVVDVGVWTEKADFSFTVSSQYLPNLPLLVKRFPTVTDVVSAKEREVAFEQALAPAVPFAEQTTFDVLGKGWTNQHVLGYGSLGLGASYASTYVFYLKGIQEEEEKAEKKRQASAEKLKKAAKTPLKANTTSTSKQTKEPKKPKDDKVSTEQNAESNTARRDDRKDPVLATSTDVDATGNELSVPLSSSASATDDSPKKKRKWFKLGFR